jgi:hypothetical protein
LRATLQALLDVPAVRAQVGPPSGERVMADTILTWPEAVILGDLDGAAVFYPEGKGAYDGHYLFPPWTRGRTALDKARGFIHQMFEVHCAVKLRGQVRVEHRTARLFTRALGFALLGPCTNGYGQPANQYELTRDRWLTERHQVPT